MNLIELGGPGAGKGTQAKRLAEHYGSNDISSGDLLRKEADKDTPRGHYTKQLLETGELFPFDKVLDLVAEEIERSPHGFILDGVPRTLEQAQQMDEFFAQKGIKVDHVIYYELPKEVALQRLAHRAESSNRSDDKPEVHEKRVTIFLREIEPILDYYRAQGKLIVIDARPSIEDIFQDTLEKLA